MKLTTINEASEYFNELYENMENYLIIISACDNIGRYMPENIADQILKLGCRDLHPKRALKGSFQFAYIAVIDKGKLEYEKLGKENETVIEYQYKDIKIVSSRYSSLLPRSSAIFYRGYDMSGIERGFNILTLDKDSGDPLDVVLIDYSEEKCVFSRPFNINFIKEYEDFRKSYKCTNIPKLALTVPEYPYGETAVVRKDVTPPDSVEQILGYNSRLKHYKYGNTSFFTSSQPLTDPTGNHYIFHGVARWKDKFIIGSDDIRKNKINVSEIKEAVGCFALTLFKENNLGNSSNDQVKVELSGDWFGSQPWFYYQSKDLTAAATSYHLLLLTLKAYGVGLELDTHRVVAAQSFFGAAFEHGMSYKMDVSGVVELPPDKRIVIDEQGNFILQNTSLYYEEHFPEEYSEERYQELLIAEKNEIIENCRAVFEHSEIDYVCSDLTGGMDSRLMLAAITNLPKSLQSKLRISTEIRSDLEKDYNIANNIAAALELKWANNSVTRKFEHIDKNTISLHYASIELGLNNERRDYAGTTDKPRHIHFIGGYGEMVTKPNGYIYCSPNIPLQSSFIRVCGRADVKQNTKAFQYAKQYISEVISEANSTDTDKAYTYYYLHFLNRHHWLFNTGSLEWTPLMSKSGFHLKMMYTSKHKDQKLRFDLMYALNPLLAAFEYDKEEVNEHKKKLHDRLMFPTNVKIEAVADKKFETFKEAIMKRNVAYYPDKETADQANDRVEELYNSKEMHLSALKTFLDYSPDFDEIGFQLFCFFNRDHNVRYHSGFRYELNRINRLLQIYWQIKIISDR